MTSISPEYSGNRSQSSPEGVEAGNGDQGAQIGLKLDALKPLGETKTTRAGKPPKRRGPKPDSKPALTRRQELNRQAQRTHRERKEMYIKALEDEVLRLKEMFSGVSQDKETLIDENKLLRDTLAQHEIPLPAAVATPERAAALGSSVGGGNLSSASALGNDQARRTHSTNTPMTASQSQSTGPSSSTPEQHAHTRIQQMSGEEFRSMTQQASGKDEIDMNQAGIDFVLSLEKPCMDHMPYLLDKSAGPTRTPSGHALMASCPPKPFQDIKMEEPFGNQHTRHEAHDHSHGQGRQENTEASMTWEPTKVDLSVLLDLSRKLDLQGEITPIMAWGMIMGHPRFTTLSPVEFRALSEELARRVKCYGFGAVMEEYEVRDAINGILSQLADTMVY